MFLIYFGKQNISTDIRCFLKASIIILETKLQLATFEKESDSFDSSTENLMSIGEDQSYCSDDNISVDDANSNQTLNDNDCIQDAGINIETNCDNYTNSSNLKVQTDNSIVTKAIHTESLIIEKSSSQQNTKARVCFFIFPKKLIKHL